MNLTNASNDTIVRESEDSLLVINIAEVCLERQSLKIPFICVMCICICPALFGNSLIIISYIRYRYFHKMAMYKYVVNMAVSDLLLGFTMFLYPLVDIVPELKKYKYFCITRFALVVVSLGSSVFFLTWISIDRFFAIVTPLTHLVKSQNKRKLRFVIALTWIFTIMAACTSYVINDLSGYDVYDPRIPCYNTAVMTPIMALMTQVVVAIVLLLDFVLYCFVLRAIIKRNSQQHLRGSAVAKTKLMIIVYVTFTVCWLPLISTEIVYQSGIGTSSKTMVCLRNFLFLLGVIQSCTNWLYYGIWNHHFRKAFRSLLFGCIQTSETTAVGERSG